MRPRAPQKDSTMFSTKNSPRGSRKFLASALSLSALMLAMPAAAQTADEADEDIVVTGTRLSDRTVTTSPAPIDVLRGDDLRASGYSKRTRSCVS